jgi:hypothetical protein
MPSWPRPSGRPRPRRFSARGSSWAGAFDRGERGERVGGGAARQWSAETRRCPCPAAARADAWCGGGTGGKGEGRGAPENGQLTSNAGEVTARRTEAGRRRNRRRGGRRQWSEMAMAAAIHDDLGRFLLQGWRGRRGASNGAGGMSGGWP